MKYLLHIFNLSWVSIIAAGCIQQGNEQNNTPPEDEYVGVGCEQDSSLWSDHSFCTLVDPCGSSCDGEDSYTNCAEVCVEIYACIELLNKDERCDVKMDHCFSGLTCQEDLDTGCELSYCEDGMCTQDSVRLYTCQPTPFEPCFPEDGEDNCSDGKVCSIASFESIECTPDGGCPNVLSNPISQYALRVRNVCKYIQIMDMINVVMD